MSILFPALLIGSGILLLYWSAKDRGLFMVLMGAFLTRLAFSLLNIIGVRFPLSDTSDVTAFLEFAEEAAIGGLQVDVAGSYVWASLMGFINIYTGDLIYSPLILNSLAGTFTVLLGYRITTMLFQDTRRALVIAVVLALMPPMVFQSASYLREATVTLFFTMFVYYLIRFGLERDVRIATVVGLFLAGSLAALLHGAFVLLPAFAVAYLLVRLVNSRLTWRSVFGYVMFGAAAMAVISVFVTYGVGSSKAGVIYTISPALVRARVLDSVTSGLMREQVEMLEGFPLLFGLVAILKFQFCPLFAEQLRLFDAVRFPLVAYLFISTVNILRRSVPYPYTRIHVPFLALSVLILGYCLVFAIGSLDPDTAFRHYTKMLPMIIAAGGPAAVHRLTPVRPEASH